MALGAYAFGLFADLSSLPTAILVSSGWLLLSALILHFIAPMPGRDEGRLLP